MHGWFSRKRLCTSVNALTIELAAITTSDPLDDLSVHTGTVVVVRVFTVVDEEAARGRLVLDDDVLAVTVVVEASIDVEVLEDEAEPHAEMPINQKGNNRRKRTL